jgi:hypothetical protein
MLDLLGIVIKSVSFNLLFFLKLESRRYIRNCTWRTNLGLLTNQTPFNLLELNFFKVIYKNLVRTSQEAHHVHAAKTNQLMLFRETTTLED